MNKKNIISLALLTILILNIFFVIAEDRIEITPSGEPIDPNSQTPEEKQAKETTNPKTPELPTFDEDPNTATKEVGKAALTSAKKGWFGIGLDEDVSVDPIKLPEVVQKPARAFFGIKSEGNIKLEKLIILIAIFIGLLILILEVVSLFPVVSKEWLKIILAILITLVISISGAINNLYFFFFELGTNLDFIKQIGPLRFILGMITLIIILFLTHYLIKHLSKSFKLEKARLKGKNLKLITKIADIEKEKVDKVANS